MNCDFQVLFSVQPENNNYQCLMNNYSQLSELTLPLNQINPIMFPCPSNNASINATHTKGSTQRILFKKEEDEKIINLVKIFGTRHWPLIAQFMNGRTAKQCRDRYSNYLMPGFFQGEWTDQEDELLMKLFHEVGPKWSLIKKSFPNRSANNIKNRWYYFLHKKVSNFAEKETKSQEIKTHLKEEKPKIPENKNDDFSNIDENSDSFNNNYENPFIQNDCDFFLENDLFVSFNNNLEIEDY